MYDHSGGPDGRCIIRERGRRQGHTLLCTNNKPLSAPKAKLTCPAFHFIQGNVCVSQECRAWPWSSQTRNPWSPDTCLLPHSTPAQPQLSPCDDLLWVNPFWPQQRLPAVGGSMKVAVIKRSSVHKALSSQTFTHRPIWDSDKWESRSWTCHVLGP